MEALRPVSNQVVTLPGAQLGVDSGAVHRSLYPPGGPRTGSPPCPSVRLAGVALCHHDVVVVGSRALRRVATTDVNGKRGQVTGVATPGSRRLVWAGWGLFLASFVLPAASYSCERAPEPLPPSAEANAAEPPPPPVAPAEPDSVTPAGCPLRDIHVVPGWQAFASALRF